jgi:hypothetical protein
MFSGKSKKKITVMPFESSMSPCHPFHKKSLKATAGKAFSRVT